MKLSSVMRWLICWLLLGVPAGFSSAQTPPASPATDAFFTSFDGTKIHYVAQGHGAPVLLLHGFTNTLAMWTTTPLYRELLAQGYRVVALDLRGNGQSAKPTSLAGYEHDAEARDVQALATALGLRHYQVVGYSRGSIIAARVLVLDPRVTAAVLGGMGEGFTNPSWPRRLAFYKALKGDTTSQELAGFLDYVHQRGFDRQTLAWQQQAQPSTSAAALAKVAVPVLVISGLDDHDNGSAEALARLLPTATVQRVPGVHNTTAQTPAFAHEVSTFLRQHSPPAAQR
jgi:pimeloyl-ACP methyl ester carboxylesterase